MYRAAVAPFIPFVALIAVALTAGCSGKSKGGGGGGSDTTPPQLSSISIANNATDVARDVTVQIVFNEAIESSSVTPTTLTWQETATSNAVAYTTSLTTDGLTLSVTPSAQLAAYTQYTIDVTDGITDAAGNQLTSGLSISAVTFTTVDDVPPDTPSAPTDAGLYNGSTTVTFNWTAGTDTGSGVASYVLQVGTTAGGNDILDTNVGNVLTYDATGADGQTLYARVAAVDGASLQGNFSTSSDGITIDTTGPSMPGTPTDDGATSSSTTVSFDWTAATDAESGIDSYVLRVGTTPGGTQVVNDMNVGNVLTATATGTDGQTLYAAVAAVNGAGVQGSFSGNSDGVTINTLVPDQPPSAPTDGGVYSTSTTVTFNWTQATNSTSTYLQVGTTSGGLDVFDGDVGAVSTYDVSGAQGQTLYARVAGVNASGMGLFSDVSDGITIDVTEPVAGNVIEGTTSGATDVDVLTTTTQIDANWPGFADTESGITLYEWAIGTSKGGEELQAFTGVGTGTSGSLSGLSLSDGVTYYVSVRATNGAGLTTTVEGDGMTVDLTAPVAGTVNDGIALDIDYQQSTTDLSANWTGFTDGQTGIDYYTWAIGTTVGGEEIQAHSSTGGLTSATATGLTLSQGVPIYVTVIAYDGAARTASASSDGVIVDASAPSGGAINDGLAADVDFQFSSTTIAANWSGITDGDSGIAGYAWAIGTTSGGEEVQAYTNVGTSTSATNSALSLSDGVTYYVSVRATNNAGLSSVLTSDGVTVDVSGPTMPGTPSDEGTYTSSTTLNFTWTAATDGESGIASYHLQLGTSAGANDLLDTNVGNVLTYDYDGSAQASGTEVYARVAAVNAAGKTGSYSGNSDGIMIDVTAPTDPGVPEDGGTVSGGDVTFSWAAASDPHSGVASYHLQVGTGIGLSDVVNENVGNVLSDTRDYSANNTDTLYAQVRAINNAGLATAYTASSDGITIDTSAPSVPGTPSDAGAYTNNVMVSFSWTAATNSADYDIEIGSSPGASDLSGGTISTGGATNYTYDATLDPDGTQIFARVRGVSATMVDGPWSSNSDGIILDTSPPGLPGTPTDEGAITQAFPTFSWTAASEPHSGPATYLLEICRDNSGISCPFSANVGAVTSYQYDATTEGGNTLYARVQAVNGPLDTSSFTGFSDGVMIDAVAPEVSYVDTDTNFSGITSISTNMRIGFTEPMTPATVESALSLDYPGSPGTWPLMDFVFSWNSNFTEVTVIPDTTPPAGVDNDDLLLEMKTFTLTVADTATDTYGNRLSNGVTWPGEFTDTFDTGDATPPVLTSIVANSTDALSNVIPPADVEAGDTLVLNFNEDMSTRSASVEIDVEDSRIEFRIDSAGINAASGSVRTVGISAITASGSVTVAFDTTSPHQFENGDVVDITGTTSGTFDIASATVTVVDDDTFTLDYPSTMSGSDNTGQAEIDSITYMLDWTPNGLYVGALVDVVDMLPSEYNKSQVRVTDYGGSSFTLTSALPSGPATQGGTVVVKSGEGDATWTGARELTLTLPADRGLPPGGSYELSAWGFPDASGNYQPGDLRVNLQVAPLSGTDVTAPVLLSTIPADMTTGVNPTHPVQLSFSEEIAQHTLSDILVLDESSNDVADSFDIGVESDFITGVVSLVPNVILDAGVTYTVAIPSTIEDLAGNAKLVTDYLSFTTAAISDAGTPVVDETSPPAVGGEVYGDVYSVRINLADSSTGFPEGVDLSTLDQDDFLVTNVTGGQVYRGWQIDGSMGRNRLQIMNSGGGGGGFWPNTRSWGIAAITASGSTTVIIDTNFDHDLSTGDPVEIFGTTSGIFDLNPGIVTVVDADTVTVEYPSPMSGSDSAGQVMAHFADFVVDVGLNDSFTDLGGNPLAPASISFRVMDMQGQVNRTPFIDYSGEMEGASTSTYRSFGAYADIREPDFENVTVTVTGANVSISEVSTDSFWRYGSDGLPQGPETNCSTPDPVQGCLDDANYPTSDYYTFTLGLDDGNGGTSSYQREAFIWAPSDVPVLGSVDGIPVSTANPILVTESQPEFVWSNVSVLADEQVMLAANFELLVMDAGEPTLAAMLNNSVTSLTAPAETAMTKAGMYLWAVAAFKRGRLYDMNGGIAWTLDVASGAPGFESLFIYGPNNGDLSGDEFGVGEIRIATTGASSMAGTYLFDGVQSVDYDVTLADGTPLSSSVLPAENYGFDGSGLMITKSVLLPGYGYVTRGGDALSTVQVGSQEDVYMTVGARRFATSGFGSSSLDGTWSAMIVEIDHSGGLGGDEFVRAKASVGTATASSGVLAMDNLVDQAGTSITSYSIMYSVASDGLVTLTDIYGNSGSETAQGYIGGSSGKEIALFSVDNDGPRPWFLVLARNFDLVGNGTTDGDFSGTYHLSQFSLEQVVSMNFLNDAYGIYGEVTFDGTGAYDFAGTIRGQTISDSGTYTINANRLEIASPQSGSSQVVVGPDLDTLLGINVTSDDQIHAFVLGR